MKIFIAVLFLSCGFAFPQVISNTQQGRLVPKKIVKPPVITIVQPVIQEDKVIMVSEKLFTIKGTYSDERGISSIKVNGVNAEFQNGEFYGLVELNPGINNISVKAISFENLSCEKSFFVTLYVDSEGPQITIIEPSVNRGIKIVSKKDVIHIQGMAQDESGVREVYVNGGPVTLDEKNHFNTDLALTMGDNTLIIKAFDKKSNLTIDTFYISRRNNEVISAGKYFAFIIGIDKYKGSWPTLTNAVHDAKSMEDELKKEYGFADVISLYNEDATRANIISKFEDLTTKISKDDNLLIFYSGHGDFKQQYNKGYWVPVDATSNSTVSFISNSDIQTYINGINSKHILLIADACFTGDIFRGQSSELPFEKSDRYIEEAYSKPSRFAMTSGNIQPVADGGKDNHSVFTYYLLKYLKEMDSKYFSARELFNNIERPVINNSEQEPQYKPLKNAGDEGGQFIFIRK
jgi:cupin superfamily acireductone dioxygenase involved in methionine salvage